jgi:NADH-quinone oxidoreductase subunit L
MDILWWIPGLPLVGALACGLVHLVALRGRRAPHASAAAHGHADAHGHAHAAGHADAHVDEHAGAHAHPPSGIVPLACALLPLCASFALALWGWFELRALEPARRALETTSWNWIEAGAFDVQLGLVLDPLSSVLALVITGVGSLIFTYALGYMAHDAGRAKFFAYLNLFAAAMLMLVLASNLLGLFVGWEGVGLCSYLLIGFWYEKGWPAAAGQKAFIVNRIGDASFLLGSFLLVQLFGTLDLSDISAAVSGLASDPRATGQLTLAALLLFGGCCGKSAQFPLFTWLPDAMAGPTPVSALIHAATMVTAGIYLIARLAPLFAASPTALAVIGCVGALTALIGASTALVQRDIKRVLAYSTVSQLGYMFLALGTGAWSAAVFHLVTHAFFKALLFLGAGSVIHGMHEEQDMHRMGGLRRHMPRTYATFLCGAAALSGLPLMSGFFSKDEILAHAFAHGGLFLALWVVGLCSAALTAFYTWRMVALTFFGNERFDARTLHPHESPAVMTVPLMVLAALALAGGLLGLPPVFHVPHVLGEWLAPVFARADALLAQHGGSAHLSHAAEWVLLGLGSAIALVAAHLGFHTFRNGPQADARLEQRSPALASFLGAAWKIDASYAARIVAPVRMLALTIATAVDQMVIDGTVNACAGLTRHVARSSRALADGSLKTYALWMGVGAAALALTWILV